MAEITSLSQLNLDGYYTYQDYLSWKFKERVELFKGGNRQDVSSSQ